MQRLHAAHKVESTPMDDTNARDDHLENSGGRVGVLLVNLGTPDATDYWSMRRYLKEFLSDKRVIEWNSLFWWPVLNGIILQRRPQKSGKLYDTIWNRERDESPLKTFTRAQAEQISKRFQDAGPQLVVDWAMRYGNPSIASRLAKLAEAGCDRIVLFPLYPQYSATSTASVNDKAFDALRAMRWQPAIRTVPAYYNDASYISALADSVTKHIANIGWQPDVVLASYHGIPQSYAQAGDPYDRQCIETTGLLREALGWSETQLHTTFQSRFGPSEWLQPYTNETVKRLAGEGVGKLAIITPGFASDCLETLEEIAIGSGNVFKNAGGQSFTYIPCLNDSDVGIDVLETVLRRELSGWL